MSVKFSKTVIVLLIASLCVACSPKIYGTVKLIDQDLNPVADEPFSATIVNIINTTAKMEQASSSTPVDETGAFETAKDSIAPGTYKVEVSRIGYLTETQTVVIGGGTQKKLTFGLKKIGESKRDAISGAFSDADKIVNPGEVNIQPPNM